MIRGGPGEALGGPWAPGSPLPLPCRGVLRTPQTPLIHFVGVGRLNGGRTAMRKFLQNFLGGPRGTQGGPGEPRGSPGDPRGAPGKIIKFTPLAPPWGPWVPQTVEGPTVLPRFRPASLLGDDHDGDDWPIFSGERRSSKQSDLRLFKQSNLRLFGGPQGSPRGGPGGEFL